MGRVGGAPPPFPPAVVRVAGDAARRVSTLACGELGEGREIGHFEVGPAIRFLHRTYPRTSGLSINPHWTNAERLGWNHGVVHTLSGVEQWRELDSQRRQGQAKIVSW